MGVRGWARLLAEEGWTPDTRTSPCCSPSLWMDMSQTLTEPEYVTSGIRLTDRIVAIPPQSELHVDGFCLCFHVYEVAYARHMNSVLYSKSNHQLRPCVRPKILQSLTAQQVRHLVPAFLPLSLLAEVTKEFVKALRDKHRMKLVVYWDGDQRYSVNADTVDDTVADPPKEVPCEDALLQMRAESQELTRSFKQDTDDKRLSRLDTEWADYHMYCQNGRMPGVKRICDWTRTLPKPRMFTSQVMHTLQLARVEMVFCEEEADRELAKAVTQNPAAYVVGSDSDFCFFPDINYIPFPTLDASRNDVVTACVIRRDTLAKSLNLPDEDAMVELAILMGNDYVDPLTADLICPWMDPRKRTNESRLYLADQGPGYRVASRSDDVQGALRFVRMLYNFDDLSEFLCRVKNSSDDTPTTSIVTENDVSSFIRPTVAADDLISCVNLGQPGMSIKESILSSLRAYADCVEGLDNNRGNVSLSPEHLTAFDQMSIAASETYKVADKGIHDKNWRPKWEDVKAVYLIEKVVHRYLWHTRSSPLARLYLPYTMFDPYKYHALLRKTRESMASNPPSNTLSTFPQRALGEPDADIVERPVLPIDEFESVILESVRKNRVTVIQGDTGCGKSSRIPIMLLRAPCPHSKMMGTSELFISQPRRIAAKALVERLRQTEPDLRDQIALRMGHGVREYETERTRAFFVTTGYLVRLMANNPQRFDRVTYLIIDEVHERSVDTDLLCLLCRRLLTTNPRIRFVLMSATLAASLFQEYFGVTEPVIKVGARRFPVEEVYLGDIQKKLSLPSRETKLLDVIMKECLNMKCTRPPSNSYMEKLYTVVASLATLIGKPGSSVLIFVSGMNDIVAITEQLKQFYVPGVTFTSFPIHSDLPFEDQMEAFVAPQVDEVKVVIATNAAESSVTLPNVDYVICLGICKQILYNEASHRQILMPTWISRASATQRAGRTGRVRPGTVYRMYHRENHDNHMLAFEPGEMLRTPLDSVILMLKEILPGEDVSEVLLGCLEPPNLSTIDRSFESLHKSHFITLPNGACLTTKLGSFVSVLGIDLTLGSLIGLGIQFGVAAEAIQIASIFSFPKSPWIQSNPLIHEPASYNEFVSTTFTSRCHFDANLYSEPLAVMNLLWDYGKVPQNSKQKWCTFYGVFLPRMKRLESTYLNLIGRVAGFLGIEKDNLTVQEPPSLMKHSKLQVLRCLQVWVFSDTVIQFNPASVPVVQRKNGVTVDILNKSDRIQKEHLQHILKSHRNPFNVVDTSAIEQKGSFSYTQKQDEGIFNNELEDRLISYSSEKSITLAWLAFRNTFTIYCRDGIAAPDFVALLPSLLPDCCDLLHATQPSDKVRRGRQERPCGLWTISNNAGETTGISWVRIKFELSKATKETLKKLESDMIAYSTDNSIVNMSMRLPCDSRPKDGVVNFSLVFRGSRYGISDRDMKDLLSTQSVNFTTTNAPGLQKLVFSITPHQPWLFENATSAMRTADTSWNRPVIACIPEGARIMAVLASGRRREHVVRVPCVESEPGTIDQPDEAVLLEFHLDQKATNISQRWKREGNIDLPAYVEPNSVPASAVPLEEKEMMYCTCANVLEVRGGGIRTEGLTLLPPGKLFLYICRLMFGLVDHDETIVRDLVRFKNQDERLLKDRLEAAVKFNSSSKVLEERLECFPKKVEELVLILNGIDGYESGVWDDLSSNPLIAHNLESLRKLTTVTYRESSRSSIKTRQLSDGIVRPVVELDEDDVDRDNVVLTSGVSPTIPDRNPTSNRSNKRPSARHSNFNVVSESIREGRILRTVTDFSLADLKSLEHLFAITLSPGEELCESDLPSSNILSIVVSQARSMIGATPSIAITSSDWNVKTITIDGSSWYFAKFACEDLAFVKRTAKSLPSWLKETDLARVRPTTIEAALICLPPETLVDQERMKPVKTIEGKQVALVFDSLELAVRMESAFWLERQFRTMKRHWYQHLDLSSMVNRLKNAQSAKEKTRE